MPRRVKILLKAALTVALLGYLASKMDFTEVRAVIASAKWFLILVALLIHFVTVTLSLVRWKVILTNFDIHSPLRRLLQILLIGNYFNLFLPTSMGGDVFRAYYLARHENQWLPTTLTTIFLDRFAGLFALLLVGTVAVICRPIAIQGYALLPLFLLLSLGFLGVTVILFNEWAHGQSQRFLAKVGRRLEEKVGSIARALRRLRRNPSAILISIAISVVIQFVVILMTWVAALALNVNAPFSVFMVFIPVVNLTMVFPLTINGLGVREYVYYLLFSEIGIPVETAVSLSLLTFLIMNVPSLAGGMIYLVADIPSKHDLAQEV